MTRALFFALIAALIVLTGMAAKADTAHVWGYLPGYQSTITLQPTRAPGAVAEVAFDNKTVHMDEDVSFALTLGDLTVTVQALVGRGLTPDRITVTPPDGFIAVPEVLDVAEDQIGVVLILPWVGM